MIKGEYHRLRLDFTFEAVTSRQRMLHKDTYLVKVYDTDDPTNVGWGECALFKGLSVEDDAGYESRLARACADPMAWLAANEGSRDSSIAFGLESAMANLTDMNRLWHSGQVAIPINGLVWMGDKATMARRIAEKLGQGFRCLKLKIGGIDFDDEVALLSFIRSQFRATDLELRLDANGAFAPSNVLERLDRLSEFSIHSLEQPIRAGQWEEMARVCRLSPIPIALDEELIPLSEVPDARRRMLEIIRPQYIILKSALCGGFDAADSWIDMAREMNIGWWATSALESNIGLDAIAGWLTRKVDFKDTENVMPQGLGTGQLYANNIPSPLVLRGTHLCYDPKKCWMI